MSPKKKNMAKKKNGPLPKDQENSEPTNSAAESETASVRLLPYARVPCRIGTCGVAEGASTYDSSKY